MTQECVNSLRNVEHFNKDKCQIGVKEIPFMEHLVTDHGLKPDPTKIEAVINMKPPTDKAGG